MMRMKNKKLKTLKNIYNYDNISYVSDEAEQVVNDLREMIKEWIKHLESDEKKFIRKFKREKKQWNKEYEEGGHREYSHNLASEWLASVPLRFADDRAKIAILKEIFNIGDENE